MSESEKKTSPLAFAAALGTAFIAGIVGGYIAFDSLTPAQPAGLTLGNTAQSVAPPNPAAIAAAESDLVRMYEGINGQFVAQLRKFGGRLNDIADIADAEGAATAAEQMRELGAETDDLVARYDKIAKQ